jgi:EmrB/QacA subfamily drug resistance transporter
MMAGMQAMKNTRATLAATILGSGLAFIDGSVVNVALPAIGHDLQVNPADLSWAINAYLLPVGALTLLGGSFGDHFGRRRLFIIGLLLFTLGTLTCAAAPSPSWLLTGRATQGLGAALLMPNSLAILGAAFSGESRGRAIGTWAAVGAISGAMGPIIGGWLVDVAGWRSIFLLNLPVATAAGWLAWHYVAETKERRAAAIDGIGALLATSALGLLTWALAKSSEMHDAAPSVWLAAVAGVILLGALVHHVRRARAKAIVPLELFASPTFVGLTLLTFFLYFSLGGLIVLLPYLLIRAQHWSAAAAGAALLPVSIGIAAGSRWMGSVAERFGGRWLLTAGSLLVGLGILLFARIGVGQISYWKDMLLPTILIAGGMGITVAPLTTSVMACVDTDHVGIASGFNSAIARVAGLIATALLGFVFVQQSSTQGFMAAFHWAVIIGALTCAVAGACALHLPGKISAPPTTAR